MASAGQLNWVPRFLRKTHYQQLPVLLSYWSLLSARLVSVIGAEQSTTTAVQFCEV
ncbi:MAG: hypothetical protein ACFB4I_20115 [Cyanophyceae cyanobacterium]